MATGNYPDRDPQLFYELARDRHANQAALLDALDTKLSVFLASSGALLSVLVAVYALTPDSFEGWEFALPIASGAAWLALTAVAVNALRGGDWCAGPTLQSVFNHSFTSEDDATQKWRVASDLWHNYNTNKKLEDRKALALRLSLGLFVIQTVLLVGALALLPL